MCVVYLHKRKIDDEIFYVGIGKNSKRAFDKAKRGPFWQKYIQKYEYYAEILFDNISWEEACEKEKELIKKYGRRDLKTGSLVNMTDGGSGGATMTGRKNLKLSERNRKNKGKTVEPTYWINKDGKNSRVKKEELESFLQNGWNIGMLNHGKMGLTNKGKSTWNKGLKNYSYIKNNEKKSLR